MNNTIEEVRHFVYDTFDLPYLKKIGENKIWEITQSYFYNKEKVASIVIKYKQSPTPDVEMTDFKNRKYIFLPF